MGNPIEFTMQWITESLAEIWQPLFLGSFLLGLFSSMLGYLTVQVLWRLNIRKRQKKRARKQPNKANGQD